MLILAPFVAAGVSVGPIRLGETYRGVVGELGKGTITHRCSGKDDLPASECSRALEYASDAHLITVTFFVTDGVERVSDILVEHNISARDPRLMKAQRLKSHVAWNWQGNDVTSGRIPISVPGWVRKEPGVFVKADRSGVAAVFERSGRQFQLATM